MSSQLNYRFQLDMRLLFSWKHPKTDKKNTTKLKSRPFNGNLISCYHQKRPSLIFPHKCSLPAFSSHFGQFRILFDFGHPGRFPYKRKNQTRWSSCFLTPEQCANIWLYFAFSFSFFSRAGKTGFMRFFRAMIRRRPFDE